MAKKQTKLNIDISNEPRRLKSRETSAYIDGIEVELSSDIDETLKAITEALRSSITIAINEFKEDWPNESVTIKPGQLDLMDFNLPIYISRPESDAEVADRVKRSMVQKAKDIAAFNALAEKLGVKVEDLSATQVSGS